MTVNLSRGKYRFSLLLNFFPIVNTDLHLSHSELEENQSTCCVLIGWLFLVPGPVSRKSRKLFGPEKPFVRLRPAYSVKLVYSYVVKGIEIKITANFVPRDAFVLKMQRELCEPKCARRLSGLSRNGPQVHDFSFRSRDANKLRCICFVLVFFFFILHIVSMEETVSMA